MTRNPESGSPMMREAAGGQRPRPVQSGLAASHWPGPSQGPSGASKGRPGCKGRPAGAEARERRAKQSSRGSAVKPGSGPSEAAGLAGRLRGALARSADEAAPVQERRVRLGRTRQGPLHLQSCPSPTFTTFYL